MYGHTSKPNAWDDPGLDALEDQFTGRDLGAEMATAEAPLYHPLRFAAAPDPWAEVRETQPSAQPGQADDPEGYIVGCLFFATPVFFIGAAMGYMAGVQGWF